MVTQEQLNRQLLKGKSATFFYGDQKAGIVRHSAVLSLTQVRKEFGIDCCRGLVKTGQATITNKQWLVLKEE